MECCNLKIRKINSLLGLNIIIVILNIVVFSPGLIGINIDFIDDFKTAIGITVIIMSIIIFIIGNYKILINSKEEVDIFKLEDDEDYINALRENSYKKVFSKDIDILLNQIERISKKQERIDDILLQKFNENEISYKNFKNIILDNNVNWDSIPRLLVITDMPQRIELRGIKVLYDDTSMSNIKNII